MAKRVIMTEQDIHNIVMDVVNKIIKEEGEGGTGGATSCGNVMQGGGTNPSAGQYDVPFLADKETEKRNEDFDNGSISMHRTDEETDVVRRPIYKVRK